ncbi:AMP-binding protein [Paraburkholderia pallida]|uniref:AMP-binding acetyl-CoA synthetase n=1 Tax=Paraburkholderia pallida TaxID=2547399 RepID=A0A4P7CTR1_9BURK|nr:AMP-binding protein [Paraburkholderia pallida]QBQ99405.1 AMP-binding acetyl-CoA synthetase [Paraburkholderia pallida]
MTIADDATLLDRFFEWESRRRDHVYLTQPRPDGLVVDYTWGEVGEQARRGAAYFLSLGLPEGSRIALLGKNSAHWIIADLAIMLAGMVSVPLYPSFSAQSVRYALAHSGAALLVLGKLDGVSDNWPNIAAQLPPGLPMLGLPQSPRKDIAQWDDVLARHAPLAAVHRPQRDALCTIVYTSGSTGEPKGVMHSHGSMAAAFLIMDRAGWWATTPDERGFSYLPLAHMGERIAVETASLAFGYRVFFADSLATFARDLKRARPTIFLSVPRLWNKFYLGVCEKLPLSKQRVLFALPYVGHRVKRKILGELGLDQARIAITATAPLPPHLMRWYRSLGLELLDIYGMSENAAISHVTRLGHARAGTVGQPQAGVEARIAGNGELEVKSPAQMLGYYGQPEMTAAQMTADGFFRTGDCGVIDAEGFLTLTGRVKDIFKTAKGKYVAPLPLEQKLLEHRHIEAACVAGAGLAMPFALLQLAADVRDALANGTCDRAALTDELAALHARINACAERHEQLQYVVVVKDVWSAENAMLTPTLKIRRAAIEARYLRDAQDWSKLGRAVVWEAR